MQRTEVQNRHPERIVLLILAAGNSSRLGTLKQLLAFKGRSLLRHAAEVALDSHAGRVVVVLGAEREKLSAELAGLDLRVVHNARWRDGLSSSIRAGIGDLPPDTDAVLVTLCDQPLITPKLIGSMVEAMRNTLAPIVACKYSGTIGVPALFSTALLPELKDLVGDAGAKNVIRRHLTETVVVPFPAGAHDIDRQEDLRSLEAGSSRSARRHS